MPPSLSGSYGPARQRGVISILTASLLVILLTLMALVVDTGRLYMEKRNLQKVADMAALDASARLPQGNCAANPPLANTFATQSASLHGFDGALSTDCVTVTSEAGLREVLDIPGPGVKVTASRTTPASILLRGGALFSDAFDGDINLSATAFAQRNSESVATFSVGGQLLNLNENQLAGQLLQGIGLNVSDLTILDSQGLANVSITPAGLLKALGVDVGINELALLTPEGLLNLVDTQVGLLGIDDLINASLELIGDSALAVELSALRTTILNNATLSTADLHLLGEGGLINLATGSSGSLRPALEGNINLGGLLSAAILAGTRGHSVAIDGLDLLGIEVTASITEPPSWATGPLGTTAYSGQVRAHVDIDTNRLPIVGFLTGLLGIRIHLPLTIDVTNAHGELTGMQCGGSESTADIHVTSTLLNVCIGDIDEDDRWSGTESCSAYVQETELITLFYAPILSGRSIIPGLVSEETLSGMAVGETRLTQPNELALGGTLDNIVAGLLDLLAGLFRPPVRDHGGELDSDIDRDRQIEYLAEHYLETTKNSAGFYNVGNVTSLILNGGSDGGQVLPPLTDDWFIPRSIPTSCLIVLCPQSSWRDGTFSQAFVAYSGQPGSLLDLLGISTLSNGYRSCSGLLSSLLNWNGCVKHNLTRFLKSSPNIENSDAFQNVANSITNPNTDTVSCSGGLCILLRPVLNLLKPILNGVGGILNTLLADMLGLEAGRSEAYVDAISCGVPTLVETSD
ncbi:MAG: pilus assembly protein TadG-related protein [Halomonas sp.]|uniref:pilus assembly protein TadG-related protein n=1 Tax=Halomonas sp. TaxID=1486246 RepID=UPI003F8F6ABE